MPSVPEVQVQETKEEAKEEAVEKGERETLQEIREVNSTGLYSMLFKS